MHNSFEANKNANLNLSPRKRTKVLSKKVAPASNVILCELEYEKMSEVGDECRSSENFDNIGNGVTPVTHSMKTKPTKKYI